MKKWIAFWILPIFVLTSLDLAWALAPKREQNDMAQVLEAMKVQGELGAQSAVMVNSLESFSGEDLSRSATDNHEYKEWSYKNRVTLKGLQRSYTHQNDAVLEPWVNYENWLSSQGGFQAMLDRVKVSSSKRGGSQLKDEDIWVSQPVFDAIEDARKKLSDAASEYSLAERNGRSRRRSSRASTQDLKKLQKKVQTQDEIYNAAVQNFVRLVLTESLNLYHRELWQQELLPELQGLNVQREHFDQPAHFDRLAALHLGKFAKTFQGQELGQGLFAALLTIALHDENFKTRPNFYETLFLEMATNYQLWANNREDLQEPLHTFLDTVYQEGKGSTQEKKYKDLVINKDNPGYALIKEVKAQWRNDSTKMVPILAKNVTAVVLRQYADSDEMKESQPQGTQAIQDIQANETLQNLWATSDGSRLGGRPDDFGINQVAYDVMQSLLPSAPNKPKAQAKVMFDIANVNNRIKQLQALREELAGFQGQGLTQEQREAFVVNLSENRFKDFKDEFEEQLKKTELKLFDDYSAFTKEGLQSAKQKLQEQSSQWPAANPHVEYLRIYLAAEREIEQALNAAKDRLQIDRDLLASLSLQKMAAYYQHSDRPEVWKNQWAILNRQALEAFEQQKAYGQTVPYRWAAESDTSVPAWLKRSYWDSLPEEPSRALLESHLNELADQVTREYSYLSTWRMPLLESGWKGFDQDPLWKSTVGDVSGESWRDQLNRAMADSWLESQDDVFKEYLDQDWLREQQEQRFSVFGNSRSLSYRQARKARRKEPLPADARQRLATEVLPRRQKLRRLLEEVNKQFRERQGLFKDQVRFETWQDADLEARVSLADDDAKQTENFDAIFKEADVVEAKFVDLKEAFNSIEEKLKDVRRYGLDEGETLFDGLDLSDRQYLLNYLKMVRSMAVFDAALAVVQVYEARLREPRWGDLKYQKALLTNLIIFQKVAQEQWDVLQGALKGLGQDEPLLGILKRFEDYLSQKASRFEKIKAQTIIQESAQSYKPKASAAGQTGAHGGDIDYPQRYEQARKRLDEAEADLDQGNRFELGKWADLRSKLLLLVLNPDLSPADQQKYYLLARKFYRNAKEQHELAGAQVFEELVRYMPFLVNLSHATINDQQRPPTGKFRTSRATRLKQVEYDYNLVNTSDNDLLRGILEIPLPNTEDLLERREDIVFNLLLRQGQDSAVTRHALKELKRLQGHRPQREFRLRVQLSMKRLQEQEEELLFYVQKSQADLANKLYEDGDAIVAPLQEAVQRFLLNRRQLKEALAQILAKDPAETIKLGTVIGSRSTYPSVDAQFQDPHARALAGLHQSFEGIMPAYLLDDDFTALQSLIFDTDSEVLKPKDSDSLDLDAFELGEQSIFAKLNAAIAGEQGALRRTALLRLKIAAYERWLELLKTSNIDDTDPSDREALIRERLDYGRDYAETMELLSLVGYPDDLAQKKMETFEQGLVGYEKRAEELGVSVGVRLWRSRQVATANPGLSTSLAQALKNHALPWVSKQVAYASREQNEFRQKAWRDTKRLMTRTDDYLSIRDIQGQGNEQRSFAEQLRTVAKEPKAKATVAFQEEHWKDVAITAASLMAWFYENQGLFNQLGEMGHQEWLEHYDRLSTQLSQEFSGKNLKRLFHTDEAIKLLWAILPRTDARAFVAYPRELMIDRGRSNARLQDRFIEGKKYRPGGPDGGLGAMVGDMRKHVTKQPWRDELREALIDEQREFEQRLGRLGTDEEKESLRKLRQALYAGRNISVLVGDAGRSKIGFVQGAVRGFSTIQDYEDRQIQRILGTLKAESLSHQGDSLRDLLIELLYFRSVFKDEKLFTHKHTIKEQRRGRTLELELSSGELLDAIYQALYVKHWQEQTVPTSSDSYYQTLLEQWQSQFTEDSEAQREDADRAKLTGILVDWETHFGDQRYLQENLLPRVQALMPGGLQRSRDNKSSATTFDHRAHDIVDWDMDVLLEAFTPIFEQDFSGQSLEQALTALSHEYFKAAYGKAYQLLLDAKSKEAFEAAKAYMLSVKDLYEAMPEGRRLDRIQPARFEGEGGRRARAVVDVLSRLEYALQEDSPTDYTEGAIQDFLKSHLGKDSFYSINRLAGKLRKIDDLPKFEEFQKLVEDHVNHKHFSKEALMPEYGISRRQWVEYLKEHVSKIDTEYSDADYQDQYNWQRASDFEAFLKSKFAEELFNDQMAKLHDLFTSGIVTDDALQTFFTGLEDQAKRLKDAASFTERAQFDVLDHMVQTHRALVRKKWLPSQMYLENWVENAYLELYEKTKAPLKYNDQADIQELSAHLDEYKILNQSDLTDLLTLIDQELSMLAQNRSADWAARFAAIEGRYSQMVAYMEKHQAQVPEFAFVSNQLTLGATTYDTYRDAIEVLQRQIEGDDAFQQELGQKIKAAQMAFDELQAIWQDKVADEKWKTASDQDFKEVEAAVEDFKEAIDDPAVAQQTYETQGRKSSETFEQSFAEIEPVFATKVQNALQQRAKNISDYWMLIVQIEEKNMLPNIDDLVAKSAFFDDRGVTLTLPGGVDKTQALREHKQDLETLREEMGNWLELQELLNGQDLKGSVVRAMASDIQERIQAFKDLGLPDDHDLIVDMENHVKALSLVARYAPEDVHVDWLAEVFTPALQEVRGGADALSSGLEQQLNYALFLKDQGGINAAARGVVGDAARPGLTQDDLNTLRLTVWQLRGSINKLAQQKDEGGQSLDWLDAAPGIGVVVDGTDAPENYQKLADQLETLSHNLLTNEQKALKAAIEALYGEVDELDVLDAKFGQEDSQFEPTVKALKQRVENLQTMDSYGDTVVVLIAGYSAPFANHANRMIATLEQKEKERGAAKQELLNRIDALEQFLQEQDDQAKGLMSTLKDLFQTFAQEQSPDLSFDKIGDYRNALNSAAQRGQEVRRIVNNDVDQQYDQIQGYLQTTLDALSDGTSIISSEAEARAEFSARLNELFLLDQPRNLRWHTPEFPGTSPYAYYGQLSNEQWQEALVQRYSWFESRKLLQELLEQPQAKAPSQGQLEAARNAIVDAIQQMTTANVPANDPMRKGMQKDVAALQWILDNGFDSRLVFGHVRWSEDIWQVVRDMAQGDGSFVERAAAVEALNWHKALEQGALATDFRVMIGILETPADQLANYNEPTNRDIAQTLTHIERSLEHWKSEDWYAQSVEISEDKKYDNWTQASEALQQAKKDSPLFRDLLKLELQAVHTDLGTLNADLETKERDWSVQFLFRDVTFDRVQVELEEWGQLALRIDAMVVRITELQGKFSARGDDDVADEDGQQDPLPELVFGFIRTLNQRKVALERLIQERQEERDQRIESLRTGLNKLSQGLVDFREQRVQQILGSSYVDLLNSLADVVIVPLKRLRGEAEHFYPEGQYSDSQTLVECADQIFNQIMPEVLENDFLATYTERAELQAVSRILDQLPHSEDVRATRSSVGAIVHYDLDYESLKGHTGLTPQQWNQNVYQRIKGANDKFAEAADVYNRYSKETMHDLLWAEFNNQILQLDYDGALAMFQGSITHALAKDVNLLLDKARQAGFTFEVIPLLEGFEFSTDQQPSAPWFWLVAPLWEKRKDFESDPLEESVVADLAQKGFQADAYFEHNFSDALRSLPQSVKALVARYTTGYGELLSQGFGGTFDAYRNLADSQHSAFQVDLPQLSRQDMEAVQAMLEDFETHFDVLQSHDVNEPLMPQLLEGSRSQILAVSRLLDKQDALAMAPLRTLQNGPNPTNADLDRAHAYLKDKQSDTRLKADAQAVQFLLSTQNLVWDLRPDNAVDPAQWHAQVYGPVREHFENNSQDDVPEALKDGLKERVWIRDIGIFKSVFEKIYQFASKTGVEAPQTANNNDEGISEGSWSAGSQGSHASSTVAPNVDITTLAEQRHLLEKINGSMNAGNFSAIEGSFVPGYGNSSLQYAHDYMKEWLDDISAAADPLFAARQAARNEYEVLNLDVEALTNESEPSDFERLSPLILGFGNKHTSVMSEAMVPGQRQTFKIALSVLDAKFRKKIEAVFQYQKAKQWQASRAIITRFSAPSKDDLKFMATVAKRAEELGRDDLAVIQFLQTQLEGDQLKAPWQGPQEQDWYATVYEKLLGKVNNGVLKPDDISVVELEIPESLAAQEINPNYEKWVEGITNALAGLFREVDGETGHFEVADHDWRELNKLQGEQKAAAWQAVQDNAAAMALFPRQNPQSLDEFLDAVDHKLQKRFARDVKRWYELRQISSDAVGRLESPRRARSQLKPGLEKMLERWSERNKALSWNDRVRFQKRTSEPLATPPRHKEIGFDQFVREFANGFVKRRSFEDVTPQDFSRAINSVIASMLDVNPDERADSAFSHDKLSIRISQLSFLLRQSAQESAKQQREIEATTAFWDHLQQTYSISRNQSLRNVWKDPTPEARILREWRDFLEPRHYIAELESFYAKTLAATKDSELPSDPNELSDLFDEKAYDALVFPSSLTVQAYKENLQGLFDAMKQWFHARDIVFPEQRENPNRKKLVEFESRLEEIMIAVRRFVPESDLEKLAEWPVIKRAMSRIKVLIGRLQQTSDVEHDEDPLRFAFMVRENQSWFEKILAPFLKSREKLLQLDLNADVNSGLEETVAEYEPDALARWIEEQKRLTGSQVQSARRAGSEDSVRRRRGSVASVLESQKTKRVSAIVAFAEEQLDGFRGSGKSTFANYLNDNGLGTLKEIIDSRLTGNEQDVVHTARSDMGRLRARALQLRRQRTSQGSADNQASSNRQGEGGAQQGGEEEEGDLFGLDFAKDGVVELQAEDARAGGTGGAANGGEGAQDNEEDEDEQAEEGQAFDNLVTALTGLTSYDNPRLGDIQGMIGDWELNEDGLKTEVDRQKDSTEPSEAFPHKFFTKYNLGEHKEDRLLMRYAKLGLSPQSGQDDPPTMNANYSLQASLAGVEIEGQGLLYGDTEQDLLKKRYRQGLVRIITFVEGGNLLTNRANAAQKNRRKAMAKKLNGLLVSDKKTGRDYGSVDSAVQTQFARSFRNLLGSEENLDLAKMIDGEEVEVQSRRLGQASTRKLKKIKLLSLILNLNLTIDSESISDQNLRFIQKTIFGEDPTPVELAKTDDGIYYRLDKGKPQPSPFRAEEEDDAEPEAEEEQGEGDRDGGAQEEAGEEEQNRPKLPRTPSRSLFRAGTFNSDSRGNLTARRHRSVGSFSPVQGRSRLGRRPSTRSTTTQDSELDSMVSPFFEHVQEKRYVMKSDRNNAFEEERAAGYTVEKNSNGQRRGEWKEQIADPRLIQYVEQHQDEEDFWAVTAEDLRAMNLAQIPNEALSLHKNDQREVYVVATSEKLRNGRSAVDPIFVRELSGALSQAIIDRSSAVLEENDLHKVIQQTKVTLAAEGLGPQERENLSVNVQILVVDKSKEQWSGQLWSTMPSSVALGEGVGVNPLNRVINVPEGGKAIQWKVVRQGERDRSPGKFKVQNISGNLKGSRILLGSANVLDVMSEELGVTAMQSTENIKKSIEENLEDWNIKLAFSDLTKTFPRLQLRNRLDMLKSIQYDKGKKEISAKFVGQSPVYSVDYQGGREVIFTPKGSHGQFPGQSRQSLRDLHLGVIDLVKPEATVPEREETDEGAASLLLRKAGTREQLNQGTVNPITDIQTQTTSSALNTFRKDLVLGDDFLESGEDLEIRVIPNAQAIYHFSNMRVGGKDYVTISEDVENFIQGVMTAEGQLSPEALKMLSFFYRKEARELLWQISQSKQLTIDGQTANKDRVLFEALSTAKAAEGMSVQDLELVKLGLEQLLDGAQHEDSDVLSREENNSVKFLEMLQEMVRHAQNEDAFTSGISYNGGTLPSVKDLSGIVDTIYQSTELMSHQA